MRPGIILYKLIWIHIILSNMSILRSGLLTWIHVRIRINLQLLIKSFYFFETYFSAIKKTDIIWCQKSISEKFIEKNYQKWIWVCRKKTWVFIVLPNLYHNLHIRTHMPVRHCICLCLKIFKQIKFQSKKINKKPLFLISQYQQLLSRSADPSNNQLTLPFTKTQI